MEISSSASTKERAFKQLKERWMRRKDCPLGFFGLFWY